MKTPPVKTDKDYLPSHYELISYPYYSGKGNHSVEGLEKICEQYAEYRHQQQIIKQGIQEENSQLLEHNRELVQMLVDSNAVFSSLKLSIMAHPDYEEGSEFDDMANIGQDFQEKIILTLTKHSKDV